MGLARVEEEGRVENILRDEQTDSLVLQLVFSPRRPSTSLLASKGAVHSGGGGWCGGCRVLRLYNETGGAAGRSV